MTDHTKYPEFDTTDLRDIDIVAVERRARKLRADAMADALRGLGGWTARQWHDLRVIGAARAR